MEGYCYSMFLCQLVEACNTITHCPFEPTIWREKAAIAPVRAPAHGRAALGNVLVLWSSGRQPGGGHEAALPGGVPRLRMQTAGDPGEEEV